MVSQVDNEKEVLPRSDWRRLHAATGKEEDDEEEAKRLESFLVAKRRAELASPTNNSTNNGSSADVNVARPPETPLEASSQQQEEQEEQQAPQHAGSSSAAEQQEQQSELDLALVVLEEDFKQLPRLEEGMEPMHAAYVRSVAFDTAAEERFQALCDGKVRAFTD